VDDLSTGSAAFVRDRVFYKGDIADGAVVSRVFHDNPDITLAVHCAGLVAVPLSITDPLLYYRDNLAKSLDFFGHLVDNGCGRLVLSSSAAVYQAQDCGAVDESAPIGPSSPYGRTKATLEYILQDCARAYPLRVIALRYFNPLGADPRMRTGVPYAHPGHVLGRMIEALDAGRPFFVTGTDWATRDGSGMRDYIHVWDLAQAHVQAFTRFDHVSPAGFVAINLGTGVGTTVFELLTALEAVTGRKMDVRSAPRRPGDTAGGFADCHRSERLLGWRPRLSLHDGIRDAVEWHNVSATV
jgi:UDP-glucose 4-epimerase